MPSIPNIAGQPRRGVLASVITQPPLSQVTELPVEPLPVESKEVPEPAIPITAIPPPTQDELAAQSLTQQTVRKRNEMTPDSEPSTYTFTDEDRAKAIESKRAKRYPWDSSPLDDALAYLAEIRAECEHGGLILQRRVSELKVEKVKCFGCSNMIDISQGRWATMRTRNNFETGLSESAYACSAACGLKLNRDFTHPTRQAAIPVERTS